MEASEVLDCLRVASERVKQWTKYIEVEVTKDEDKRNKDRRYESSAENERYEVPPRPQIWDFMLWGDIYLEF